MVPLVEPLAPTEFISKEEEYEYIKSVIEFRERAGLIDAELKHWLEIAFGDMYGVGWDWYVNSDGCTFVDERGWPTKNFPPCVAHDYDCYRANQKKKYNRKLADNIRRDGDRLFYKANIAFGVDKFAFPRVWRGAIGRWIGVRLGWIWSRWRKKSPKWES